MKSAMDSQQTQPRQRPPVSMPGPTQYQWSPRGKQLAAALYSAIVVPDRQALHEAEQRRQFSAGGSNSARGTDQWNDRGGATSQQQLIPLPDVSSVVLPWLLAQLKGRRSFGFGDERSRDGDWIVYSYYAYLMGLSFPELPFFQPHSLYSSNITSAPTQPSIEFHNPHLAGSTTVVARGAGGGGSTSAEPTVAASPGDLESSIVQKKKDMYRPQLYIVSSFFLSLASSSDVDVEGGESSSELNQPHDSKPLNIPTLTLDDVFHALTAVEKEVVQGSIHQLLSSIAPQI